VGAIAVHGIGGTFGVICVGLFANGVYGNGWNLAVDDNGEAIPLKGVFYGEFGQLGAQLVGVIVIWTVIFGIAFAFFKIQNKFTKGGIRVTEEVEIAGLDIPEMGVAAYND
jgi:ammonium transporter, Amt family